MLEMIEANWMVVGASVVAALVALWLMLGRARKPARRSFRPDVLDEGVAPAIRNQVLIDAAPAAVVPPVIPEVVPAQSETPEPAALAATGDNLSRIKGLGPKLVVILEGLGVTRFAQIAAWSDDDLAHIDAQLGVFAGRPARDSWVEQAKFLAVDDVSGFEAKFGKV